MSSSSEAWHAVDPQGLAAALLGVTITFTILCLVVVGLRIWTRISTRCFGLDDWLMCLGTTINMAHNGIVIWGSYTGIGTPDSKLNPAMMMEGAKAIVFWQISYVSGSVFIKASICAQLIRISTQRRYKVILILLIAATAITTLIAILAVLVRCKPIAASWNPALGTCINQDIIIDLTYAVSAVNIVTDWSVAIIPIFILRNVQMRATLKRLTRLVLGVGALASVATIIRMPYSTAYSNPKNLLYNVGNVVLWTVVECGLGIIAGSMPMLRKLIKGLAKDESSLKASTGPDVDLVTIGRVKGRHYPTHETDIQVTVAAEEPDIADDDESTKRIIRVMKSVDQISTEVGNESSDDGKRQRKSFGS
ncbi:hypothetical protein F5884DRAFT_849523 [Xylogone sp. PMI_703]|nr:hypothetical protein F5884DRAFT_849523 [Xylogone sp. PMI_703]